MSTTSTLFTSDADPWHILLSLLLVSITIITLILYTNEPLLRQVEGKLGGILLHYGGAKLLSNAGLIKKEIVVESGLLVHYYERLPAVTSSSDQEAPVLLLCHGMTSEAKNLAALISLLGKELPEFRMIAPDSIGHGHDLGRARKLGVDQFPYPNPIEMGEAIGELLEALDVKKCYAYGASLGGAMVYFGQQRRPDIITHSMLISPAVEAVLDDKFIEDWETGRKNHFCFTSREDIRQFMSDLSCPQRRVANPIPTFLLQAMWEQRQEMEPTGHFRKFFQHLLDCRGRIPNTTSTTTSNGNCTWNDPVNSKWLACEEDCAPELPRLVMWPEEDFISNYDKGWKFFANSNHTLFTNIPQCGHLFHSDGKTVLVHAAPMMVDYIRKTQRGGKL